MKLQNAATKIPYSSSTTDWIPEALDNIQTTQNYWQSLADNTEQGRIRKIKETALEERKNQTFKQRIVDALTNASDQPTMTEKLVQDRLNEGDIQGATDIAKTGLTGVGLGYLTASMLPIVSSAITDFGTYGLLGGLGKQGGMWGGSYLLGKGGEEVGKGLDNIFNTGKTFETGFGLAGGLAGFGWGSKSGYNLAKSMLAKRMATKGINSAPNWVATNAMKRDLINDAYNAGWRYTPTNYRKLPEWSSNYETPVMQYGSFTLATATNASWDKFLAKTPQEQDNIVRYWNGEKYGNFNVLKYDRKGLDSFKRWWSKLK